MQGAIALLVMYRRVDILGGDTVVQRMLPLAFAREQGRLEGPGAETRHELDSGLSCT